MVNQHKEWGEILTGFEIKNRYSISDESGRNLYLATEKEGSTLLRWFLKVFRPFNIKLTILNNNNITNEAVGLIGFS